MNTSASIFINTKSNVEEICRRRSFNRPPRIKENHILLMLMIANKALKDCEKDLARKALQTIIQINHLSNYMTPFRGKAYNSREFLVAMINQISDIIITVFEIYEETNQDFADEMQEIIENLIEILC